MTRSPGFEPVHLAADLGNLTRELVALDNRVGSVRMSAVVDVKIGAADSDAANPQQDIFRPEARFRDNREFNFTRADHGGAKHNGPFHPSECGMRIIPVSAGICKRLSR